MRSFVLPLVLLILVLSAPNLAASESQDSEKSQNRQSVLPPRDRPPQQRATSEHTTKSDNGPQSAPSPSASVPRSTNQPPANPKNEDADQTSYEIWKKAVAPDTLTVMNAQVDAATRSADATKVTADALIDSERARVFVRYIAMTPTDFKEPHRRWTVTLTLINCGRTVALMRADFHAKFTTIKDVRDLPIPPAYPDTTKMPSSQHTHIFLKPNEEFTTTEVPIDPVPTGDQLNDIQQGKVSVIIYARITYFDVFSPDERSTQICSEYVHLTREWVPAGPREYNKHT